MITKRSLAVIAVVALLAAAAQKYYVHYRGFKDGTAQGVAKIRHYEALHKPSTRLYYDPYAEHMYPGSFAQTWLGESGTKRLYDLLMKGALEMLTTRTKWLDDEVMNAIRNRSAKQMVILGAGYDTRGFRLNLPDNFRVMEVDQPTVQTYKKRKLENIAKSDKTVASRMERGMVTFVPVDFNKDSLDEKILNDSNSLFVRDKSTIVILEGVTQYIPKTSTADALAQIHRIVPPQSTLLVSYVPQDVFDNPSKCGPLNGVKIILKASEATGEPWISGWTPQEFKLFLSELGYEILSDTTLWELNERYLVPIHRDLKNDEVLSMERYVVAVTKGAD